MKKSDKEMKVWGLIVILMVVGSAFGGAVSAENVSEDLTKSIADAEIQVAVNHTSTTDETVNIEFWDKRAPLVVIKSNTVNKPSVVSRTGWGCHDGQSSPSWPSQYHTVTHIIIHHTVTPNTDTDWPARVRQIWDYHTNTKGWGDIGYNYLIDPNGVIYEGRAGGDDVIAGHAYGHNVGTMGVAFLGTFSTVEPTSAALRSAESLLAWKCDQRNINPLGSGTDHAGTYYKYIAGHRDVSATECPGDKLYNLLPTIRQNVFNLISGQPDLIVEDIWVEPVEFGPGDTIKLWQRTKNIGAGDAVGTFRIQRYFDGTPISYANKNGLAAGASYTSYCTYTWPSDCNLHTVKVVADLYDAITESNEGNNERSESFSAICEDVDLTVTSVNAPSSAEVGGYIAVSWTVKNQGSAASGSFYNRISLATTPYGTDISLGNYPMSSIAAGSSSSDAEVPKIPETVSPGYYYVTVFADAFDDVTESDEDNNINKAPSQIHITQPDTTPPPPPTISSSTHPNENNWYANNDPSFTWTTPSDPSGIAGYSYTSDHSSSTTPDTSVDTTGNSASYSNKADGTWYFHVRAKDGAENWGSADHYRVKIDTANPPAPTISSSTHPNENNWYNNNDPSFTWNTPSDTSGIAGYSYTLDHSSSTAPDTSVDTTGNSKSYTNKADGTWYFHVRAKDNAGNWGSADHYRVKIDTANPPAPTISSSTHPNENNWYDNNDPSFTWTTPSDTSGIAGYSYTIDHSSSTIPDTSVDTTGNSASYSNKADGTWYFHVRAKDNAGNWGSADHYRVKIDTANPPAPAISSSTHPNENNWYANNDPSFTWTTPSDTSGIAGYSYTLDHSSSTTPDTSVDTTGNSASYSNKADGTWYFHVRAKDGAENWGSADHYRVKIDTANPPAPTISSSTHPNENNWYNNNDPSFTWNTPSDTSGIAGYSYALDHSSSTTPDTSVDTTGNSKSYSNKADGTWYFHVSAKDNAGNWGSADHYRVKIDTADPSVTVNSPNGGENWKVGTQYAITWTATDNVGVTSVDIKYSINGGSTYPHTIATGEPNDGTYTWTIPNTPSTTCRVKVIAYDAGGNSGEDASNSNFIIFSNNPPNAPSNPSPTNHATDQSIDADLSWTGGDPDAGDTVTYDVYFGTSTSPALVSNDQSGTTYDPGTLSYDIKYYWKIVATDNHGAATTGPLWDFTTGSAPNNPPNTPSNPSPANHATDQSINADLSWTGGDPDAGDTVTYDVYFGTSTSPPLVSNDQSGTTYDPGTLSHDTKYYWKIIATDNHGESTSGPTWDFTIGSAPNNPPNTPSNPSPVNHATDQSIHADLSWTGGDPDAGDTVTYNVYFGTSTSPPLVSNDQSGTTYDPGTLSYNTKYYWKIIATDNHGASTSGPLWDFTTGSSPNNPPNMPSNPSPSNHATDQSIHADLSWTSGDPDAGDTVTYDIYFGTSTSPPLVSNDQSGASYDPGALSYDTKYYWKIIATDNHGASTSGHLWDFTTTGRPSEGIFDTGLGTYPSISGMHNGTIKPNQTIIVQKLYTYPCAGTGGHTEYARIWNESGWNVTAIWDGYVGDWQNITFDEPFTLFAEKTYYYEIRTGSYPQIIHKPEHTTLDGSFINCTSFVDANGKEYTDWIPAIRLFL